MVTMQEPPKNDTEKKIQEDAQEAFKQGTSGISSMPRFAARLGDNHLCPLVNGIIPHVGGPISGPGEATVVIGGQPAAVIDDTATCTGPPDQVISGSQTVKIGGKSVLRVADQTDHGGLVVQGLPSVTIGD